MADKKLGMEAHFQNVTMAATTLRRLRKAAGVSSSPRKTEHARSKVLQELTEEFPSNDTYLPSTDAQGPGSPVPAVITR